MKKLLSILIAVACFITSAGAEAWRVFDNAGLFSAENINTIEQAIFQFQRETNYDFAVLTTDDYIGKANWKAIADSFYDSQNFGFGHQANGMLYYIDMNQRIPYVSTAGEMISVFDSDTLNNAHDLCYTYLASGKYTEAVLIMIESARRAAIAYEKDAD